MKWEFNLPLLYYKIENFLFIFALHRERHWFSSTISSVYFVTLLATFLPLSLIIMTMINYRYLYVWLRFLFAPSIISTKISWFISSSVFIIVRGVIRFCNIFRLHWHPARALGLCLDCLWIGSPLYLWRRHASSASVRRSNRVALKSANQRTEWFGFSISYRPMDIP